MKIWPSDEYELLTPLAPEQIVMGLKSRTEPENVFYFSSNRKLFQGSISSGGFKFFYVKGNGNRNSFRPLIIGRFSKSPAGTVIRIRMRLHGAVLGFMCYWLGFLSLFLLMYVVKLLSGEPNAVRAIPVILGMLAFGCILPCVGFWSETDCARQILLQVLREIERENESMGAQIQDTQ